MNNKEILTLELRYIFSDSESHSMNAKIYNECEKMLINALESLNKYVDSTIEIEVLAREEGSLRSIYKIISNNKIVLIILTAFLTSFFSAKLPHAVNKIIETKSRVEIVKYLTDLANVGELTPESFDYIAKRDKDLKKIG